MQCAMCRKKITKGFQMQAPAQLSYCCSRVCVDKRLAMLPKFLRDLVEVTSWKLSSPERDDWAVDW